MTKEENIQLCKRYPFLIPRNRFSGKRITEGAGFWPGSPDTIPEWDYDFTELDDMPVGWRKAFGDQLCEELKAALEKAGLMDTYAIDQIKEKYGELCWYDHGGNDETAEITRKYERLSARTCIVCGKPATKISKGWISPYCDVCIGDDPYIPIQEYYKPVRTEEDDDAGQIQL